MHSSRMRTVRNSSRLLGRGGGACSLGGVSARGGGGADGKNVTPIILETLTCLGICARKILRAGFSAFSQQ